MYFFEVCFSFNGLVDFDPFNLIQCGKDESGPSEACLLFNLFFFSWTFPLFKTSVFIPLHYYGKVIIGGVIL